jgi:hypothetical protein
MARDQSEIYESDGNIVSSSQIYFSSERRDRGIFSPMEGIIVEVKPSDDPDNLTSTVAVDKRGWRHECTVLIVDNNGEPNLLLDNVVIPPSTHSGTDNYEEDLPRGVVGHIDKEQISEEWKQLDISRLDGEHCLVGFVGGSLDKPFIQNWWPHPANKFDPATSGQACLEQADPKKNKFRSMRRLNGVLWVINRDGDLYFSTNEASSKVEIGNEGKVYERKLKDKGGSVQIDIKKNKQLEVNWNKPVVGLSAGSNSQSQTRDPDLPHPDQAKAVAAYTPPKRETDRTFFRHKEFEMFEKTSQFNVYCENTESKGGKKGEYTVLADDGVNIFVKNSSGTVTTISITNDGIQFVGNDGTQFAIDADEIKMATKSGGFLSMAAKAAAMDSKLDLSGPLAVGGVVESEPVVKGTTLSNLMGDYLDAEVSLATINKNQYQALADACTGPLLPLKTAFEAIKESWVSYGEAANTLKSDFSQVMAKMTSTS